MPSFAQWTTQNKSTATDPRAQIAAEKANRVTSFGDWTKKQRSESMSNSLTSLFDGVSSLSTRLQSYFESQDGYQNATEVGRYRDFTQNEINKLLSKAKEAKTYYELHKDEYGDLTNLFSGIDNDVTFLKSAQTALNEDYDLWNQYSSGITVGNYTIRGEDLYNATNGKSGSDALIAVQEYALQKAEQEKEILTAELEQQRQEITPTIIQSQDQYSIDRYSTALQGTSNSGNSDTSALSLQINSLNNTIATAQSNIDAIKNTLAIEEQAQSSKDYATLSTDVNRKIVPTAESFSIPVPEGITNPVLDYGLVQNADETELQQVLDYITGYRENGPTQAQYLNETQKDTLIYLASKGEWDTALSYWGVVRDSISEEQFQEKVDQYNTRFGEIASTVAGIFASAPAYMSTAILAPTGKSTTTEGFAGAVRLMNEVQNLRSENRSGFENFLIQGGTSLAQNIANVVLFGPNALLMMGMEAAGMDTIQQMANGKSATSALGHGTLMGIAEVLTEYLPLDNLVDAAETIGKGLTKATAKQWLKTAAIQSGIELVEETVNQYAQTLIDVAYYGDDSQYKQYIAKLMDDGKSYAEAKHEADTEYFVVQPLEAGAQGAMSGFIMGGGSVAVGNAANTAANSKAAALIGSTLQEAGQYHALLESALQLDANSDAYQLASKLQSGKMKATAKNIGDLFSRYVRDGGDFRSFVAAAAAQSETTTVGETLSAMDSGTLALFAHLFNTDSSQSVLSELNQGKRPSNELLKQFADETGLAKRAMDISRAFQSEQSALSDLRQAQARYRIENTTQAQTALSDAQSAYVSAVSQMNAAAKEVGINSAEGLQNLRNALGGTEDAALSERAGAVNSPVQIAGYSEDVPSGLTLPGAELFAQNDASKYESVEPALTLPGAEILNAAYQSERVNVASKSAQTQAQLAAQYSQVQGTLESLNVGDKLVSPATGETAYTVTVRTNQGITLEGSAGEINIPNGTMPLNGQRLGMQLTNGTLQVSQGQKAQASIGSNSGNSIDTSPQNGNMGVGSNAGTGTKGAGDAPTKPYTTSRPKYGKTQVDDVWNNYKDPTTGKAPDPAGESISWDKTKPRQGQWDMGHIPGEKYSDMRDRYIRGEISQKEFLEWYRNPANYRPELPSTNRSHKYEQEAHIE